MFLPPIKNPSKLLVLPKLMQPMSAYCINTKSNDCVSLSICHFVFPPLFKCREKNKKILCIYIRYRGRDIFSRGTTSVYRFLTIAAFKSVKQHSCSVTGTPVAAYLKKNLCSVHCSQDVFSYGIPIVLHQPTTLFKRINPDLLVPAQTHLLKIIIPLENHNVKNFF